MNEPAVAEIQGLYGPVIVSELLLQKIWLRRDFILDGLKTMDGRALKILSPGNWNRLDGPDFKDAGFEIGGQRVGGDVEVHFYQQDWFAHGHDKNPLFNNVALHVVLFDPAAAAEPARTMAGKTPAAFVLLPWLSQDLEEYAVEEVITRLGQADTMEAAMPLLRLPVEERRKLLREHAVTRWEQKLRFARSRLEKTGWEESCHQCCLEVLGYRRNRAPMSDIAARFPHAMMRSGQKEADYYYNHEIGSWKLRGLRPANHPLPRLKQYLGIIKKRPDWPQRLKEFGARLPKQIDPAPTGEFRKRSGLKKLRAMIAADVLAGNIGGPRLDTLVCDAFLPLLSAGNDENLLEYWFNWFAGDAPDSLQSFLKIAQITGGRKHPACNGFNQGALQILIVEGRP